MRQREKNFDIQRYTRVGSGGQFTSNRLSCHHIYWAKIAFSENNEYIQFLNCVDVMARQEAVWNNNNKRTRGIESQWGPLDKQGLVSTSRHGNPLLSGPNASQMRKANADLNSKSTGLRAPTPLRAPQDSFICATRIYEACPFPHSNWVATFRDSVNYSPTHVHEGIAWSEQNVS